MTKLMQITGYNTVTTKYGKRSIVYGVLYNNVDTRVKGNQTYSMWVNQELDDNCLGKTLFVEFNAIGKISRSEVK